MTRQLKISNSKVYCTFCGEEMHINHREYISNPFCNDRECYDKRLEASGAIDLRDNHKVVDLGDGYVNIKAIDENKKFKAGTK